MGQNKRMAACRLALYTQMVAWLLISCAQPTSQEYHETTTTTEFATRIDTRASYHHTGDRSFVVVDFSNQRGIAITVWLVQTAATDGESVTRSTRIYEGNDRAKQILYRVDGPQAGIVQTFMVEIFNEQKKLIVQSRRITVEPDKI